MGVQSPLAWRKVSVTARGKGPRKLELAQDEGDNVADDTKVCVPVVAPDGDGAPLGDGLLLGAAVQGGTHVVARSLGIIGSVRGGAHSAQPRAWSRLSRRRSPLVARTLWHRPPRREQSSEPCRGGRRQRLPG